MTFELPKLDYKNDALAPVMSQETLDLHHGKHHQTYVTNLNNLVKDTDLAGASLEEIVKKTAKDSSKAGIFNNAGQHWNHILFWKCMKPKGGGAMPPELEKRIVADFGSVDKFKEVFIQAGVTQFGSGWAWLVADKVGGKLSIAKTGNADTPLAHDQVAVLTCDVWEHAYYIDYRNRRPDYVDTFLDKLVNWDYANAKYKGQDAGVEE